MRLTITVDDETGTPSIDSDVDSPIILFGMLTMADVAIRTLYFKDASVTEAPTAPKSQIIPADSGIRVARR